MSTILAAREERFPRWFDSAASHRKKSDMNINIYPTDLELKVDSRYSEWEAWIDLLIACQNGATVSTVAVTIDRLAKRWGWSKSSVARFLRMLESTERITYVRLHDHSEITVNKTRDRGSNSIKHSLTLVDTESRGMLSVKEPKEYHYTEDNAATIKGLDMHMVSIEELKQVVKTKQDINGKPFSSEYRIAFAGFTWWLRENAPYCSDPKNLRQMTLQDFTALRVTKQYTSEEIRACIIDLENAKNRRGTYVSLYQTLTKWLLRRKDERGFTGK